MPQVFQFLNERAICRLTAETSSRAVACELNIHFTNMSRPHNCRGCWTTSAKSLHILLPHLQDDFKPPGQLMQQLVWKAEEFLNKQNHCAGGSVHPLMEERLMPCLYCTWIFILKQVRRSFRHRVVLHGQTLMRGNCFAKFIKLLFTQQLWKPIHSRSLMDKWHENAKNTHQQLFWIKTSQTGIDMNFWQKQRNTKLQKSFYSSL